jgi:hypothetical protein
MYKIKILNVLIKTNLSSAWGKDICLLGRIYLLSSIFYYWAMWQTVPRYAANYIVILVVMQNVVQCPFSVFIIRWTSYLYIRVFVSSRVCGILVVEGPLLI